MSPSAATSRIAILAALPREVAPLVRNWATPVASHADGARIWESDRAVVVCAGMGRERVTRAFELAETSGPLHLIISVGYAGALRNEMQLDRAYWPAAVIDGESGERFACEDGEGILVTVDHTVGREEKPILAAKWHADLVDMEAATVAQLARSRSLPFRALRTVSDKMDDNLPDFSRFIDPRGGFRSGSFAMYVALHPWLIPATVRLGNQSKRASRVIAQALLQILRQAE